MFVTGQAEVHRLCRKLRKTFPSKLRTRCDSDIGDCGDSTKEQSGVSATKSAGKHRKGRKQTVKEINLDEYVIVATLSPEIWVVFKLGSLVPKIHCTDNNISGFSVCSAVFVHNKICE